MFACLLQYFFGYCFALIYAMLNLSFYEDMFRSCSIKDSKVKTAASSTHCLMTRQFVSEKDH